MVRDEEMTKSRDMTTSVIRNAKLGERKRYNNMLWLPDAGTKNGNYMKYTGKEERSQLIVTKSNQFIST